MSEEVYESLLLYKTELEKECLSIEREYYGKFGDSLLALLKLKLEVAKTKQKIAYCQKMKNQGLDPDEDEMEAYAKSNCADAYFAFIDASAKKKQADHCKEGPYLKPEEVSQSKKLFRALMKMLHPDIHPELANNPLASSIYEHALTAYKQNNLHQLVELYDLASMQFGDEDVEIENVDEKIERLKEEIDEIESHNPYLYRVYLENPDKGKTLLDDLKKQTKEYEDFLEELIGRLSLLLSKEVGEA